MQKITSIHLNGKAYQLEEEGYAALRAYLTTAESQLAENPDKAEIMSDLEQAIGEKCTAFLNANKDVVTKAEVEQVIQEMGPVEEGSATKEEASTSQTPPKEEVRAPKRLFLIGEGAYIAGVCTGLAAYFDLDVTIVRAIFVILTVLTSGAWCLVYAALMFLVPYANTKEDRAAAHGEPFNAQELIKRAKENYAHLSNEEEWRQRFAGKYEWHAHKAKAQMHRARHQMRHARQQVRMRTRGFSPFFGFVSAALAILWIWALVSLVSTGAVFGWMIPGLPIWAAIVLLFVAYHAFTGPFRANYDYQSGVTTVYHSPWMTLADMMSAVFIGIVVWFAYTHYPSVHGFINNLLSHAQQVIGSVTKK